MRPFEEDLAVLNDALQDMGALVAHAIQRSVRSLVEKNEDYAHQVIRDESRVDQMEIQIDDMVATLIVREQPVARDMRLIVAAIKISTDLERMGRSGGSCGGTVSFSHVPARSAGTRGFR